VEIVKQYDLGGLPATAGRRPVLLLSRNERIAVEVPLGRSEGLPAKCVANCDNVRTVPRSALTKRIGQLSPARYPELKRALGHALAWEELIDAA
jgi:mRNA-degrading endonuclease toxin of MazEF toxin-antitoxin module